MPPPDLRAPETLRRVPDASQVRCVVHILASSPEDDPGVFEIEVLSSTDDLRMAWSMLCAARAEFMEQHGFTDADAVRKARP